MDDTLRRLLEAEQKADALVKKAQADRDRIVETALEEIKAADARFRARIPELRESFHNKAEERAAQAIAEVRRRYSERRDELDEEIERRRDQSVSRGLDALLTISRD